MRNIFIALAISVIVPAGAFAQENPGSTYIKIDFTRTSGQIEGIYSDVRSLAIGVESDFGKDKIFLSGWSVAYRKEDIKFINAGHYFTFKTFHDFDTPVTESRLGGGVEWGYPSLGYEKTVSAADSGQPSDYRHLFLVSNSAIPRYGTKHDGTLYPFLTLSLVKRLSVFIFEGGLRMDVRKFGIDSYTNGQYSRDERWIASPSVFVGFGLKTAK